MPPPFERLIETTFIDGCGEDLEFQSARDIAKMAAQNAWYLMSRNDQTEFILRAIGEYMTRSHEELIEEAIAAAFKQEGLDHIQWVKMTNRDESVSFRFYKAHQSKTRQPGFAGLPTQHAGSEAPSMIDELRHEIKELRRENKMLSEKIDKIYSSS